MLDKTIPTLIEALDLSDHAVYATNQDLTLEYMNPLMVRLFGSGLGKPCHTLINRTDIPCPWCKKDAYFNRGFSRKTDITIPFLEHKFTWIQIPLNNTDGTCSRLGIFKFENPLMCNESQFVSSGIDTKKEHVVIELMKHELIELETFAALGRLTATITHELKNPLFGIMNTLELLKTEVPPTSKRRKLLDMSLSEIQRLSGMLNNLLCFSIPDSDESSWVSISDILEEILLFHEHQLAENSILLVTNFSNTAMTAHATRSQLRQIFLNLITNALDAMPHGGYLNITTRIDEASCIIEITDSGSGIKKKHLDDIFKPFFTTKSGRPGRAGLGLFICRELILKLDGEIQVESQPGKGCLVRIVLPKIISG